MTKTIAVLIPAYRPDESMLELLRTLRAQELEIAVVDDGSGNSFAPLFAEAEALGCHVLTHPENKGKGRALKTGLAFLHSIGFAGAVTADADGQHTCADILRVAQALTQQPQQLVLGVRDVAKMPPRSKFGNAMTCALVRIFYSLNITDTQTGLRGIPLRNTQKLLALRGERYEYEMNVLLFANDLFDGIQEVCISTIYLNENAASHFNPIVDGLRIYRVLFASLPKFLASSLLAFAIDYALFNAAYYSLGFSAIAATAAARAVSSVVNFCVNRQFVFGTKNKEYTFFRYFSLAVLILLVNTLCIFLLVDVLHLPAAGAKLLVESLLYLASYTVQAKLAQRRKK